MADTYEQNLGQKSSLTASDFIRVVGSDNVSYKQPVEDVLYAGGVRYKEFPTGTAFSDFADSCNIGITLSYIRFPLQSSDSPTSINGRCAVTVCKTYSDEITMSVTFFTNATENVIYERRRYGTWGSWVQRPTRAEIDALNSKIQIIDKEFKVEGGWASAPTLGSRIAQVSAPISLSSTQYIIGISMVYIGNSAKYIPVPFIASGNLYCNDYAASTGACSESETTVRVRLIYMQV